MELTKNLERLCGLCGVSGWEDPVREEILHQLQGICECRVDPLGNVIAFKKGQKKPGKTIMLDAHMDEVGFVITYIEESGLLRFAAVGGIDSRVVLGKAVEVGDCRLRGVIGTKAVHQQEEKERSQPQKLDKLYIDIGASSREEALAHVAPGDRAVFHAPFGRLGASKVFGRALDDRAGCAILLELAQRKLAYDCYVVFSVQEEVGASGAKTAAFSVAPDLAFVVEATTASDIAGVPEDKVVCRQGNGPVLSFMDRGAVYDRGLYELALRTAQQHGIPCQSKAGVYGMNGSAVVQPSRGGVKTLGISLPCRYLHAPVNVLELSDVYHTVGLLEALVEAAGADELSEASSL